MSSPLSRREVSVSDADDLLFWRNDPSIMKFQRNRFPIDRETHLNWLLERIEMVPALPFIIYESVFSDKVGAVRLDLRVDNEIELSIIVNPEFRGRGYGKQILLDFLTDLPAMNISQGIVAYIHFSNQHSLRLFQDVGFRCSGQREEDLLAYRYNPQETT